MTYRRGPEYGRSRLGRFAIIGGLAFTAACQAEVRPTPTSEIFPSQPQSTEVFPTPTSLDLVVAGISQDRNEILAAFGDAVGAGGAVGSLSGPIDKVFNNSIIQNSLNRNSLAPVLDSERVVTQISQFGDQRVCFPNMPEVLFNPNVASGQDDWLFANNLIVAYGDTPSLDVRFKGLGAVSLKDTREDIVCVNAVINSDNNPFGERRGKVLNVLMDRNTGEIFGTLPGIYGADEDVRFDFATGQLIVGNSTTWYVGDKMAELTAQPTFRSEINELQESLRLQGVETELVENEQGVFVWNHIDGQVQVEIGRLKHQVGELVFNIGKIGKGRVFSLDQVTIEQDTARLVFLTNDGRPYFIYDPNELVRFRWSQVGEEFLFAPLEVLDKDGEVTLRIGVGESLRQSVDWNGLAWNGDLVLKNYVDPEGKPHDSLGSQERLLEAWHVAIWTNAKYNGLNSPDLSLDEVRTGTKVNIRFRDDTREVDTGKAFNFVRSAGGLRGDYSYLLSRAMYGGIEISVDGSGSITMHVTQGYGESLENSVDIFYYLTLLDLSMPSMTEGDQFFGILDYRLLKSYHPNIKTVDSLLELVFEIDRANINIDAEDYSWLNVYAYRKEGAENNLVWPTSRSQ